MALSGKKYLEFTIALVIQIAVTTNKTLLSQLSDYSKDVFSLILKDPFYESIYTSNAWLQTQYLRYYQF